MRARIKFSKYGIAKFLGHLDVVRYFQKAIRRSGLAISYSHGFNPHQLLYFAAPLGLGHTSDGEYLDAEFDMLYSAEEITKRLGAEMGEGFAVMGTSILKDWQPNEKKESIMSLTSCADYMVSVKDLPCAQNGIQRLYAGYFFNADKKLFQENMQKFCSQEKIMAERITKKNKKTVDIKPMIFAFGFAPEAVSTSLQDGICHAENYENDLKVFFKLSSGSTDNLKPELVMEAFCTEYGIPYFEYALQIHRMETYCRQKQEFVPLCELSS